RTCAGVTSARRGPEDRTSSLSRANSAATSVGSSGMARKCMRAALRRRKVGRARRGQGAGDVGGVGGVPGGGTGGLGPPRGGGGWPPGKVRRTHSGLIVFGAIASGSGPLKCVHLPIAPVCAFRSHVQSYSTDDTAVGVIVAIAQYCPAGPMFQTNVPSGGL